MVHVLEGVCHAVLSVLKALSEHAHFSRRSSGSDDEGEWLQQGRVVYNVEDRPERFYPEW